MQQYCNYYQENIFQCISPRSLDSIKAISLLLKNKYLSDKFISVYIYKNQLYFGVISDR